MDKIVASPHWRYSLHVEIPATDAAVLVDALEGEPFGLRDRLGADELERQIRELELTVERVSSTRWDDLEKDIEILSIYLPQYIVGREIHVEPGTEAPKLEGWKIVALRGQTERLLLRLTWNAEAERIEEDGEDVEDIKRRWTSLADWVRSAMRTNHPSLSAL